MKCSAAQPWLLGAKHTPDLPSAVQQHLRRCPDCRVQFGRLLRLNQEMRELLWPPPQPGAQARLLQQLDEVKREPARPAARVFVPMYLSRRLWRVGMGAMAAALLLGLGLGLWLAHRGGTGPTGPSPVAASPDSTNERQVVHRAMEHDLRLAQTVAPEARFDALAALSADLEAEALRLAERGKLDDLATLTGLYDQVLRRGVIGQARQLPAPRQAETTASVARRLAATEKQALELADRSLPALGDHLRSLAVMAQDTSRQLQSDLPPLPPLPPAPKTAVPRNVLGSLVLNGLRLAEEDDPLRRADVCSDVADQLVQTILQASAAGDEEEASRLGKLLGDMMDHGVAANLDQVPHAEREGARRDEWDQVGRRAVEASAALEKNLEQAPAPARKGLERALAASSKGREKACQKVGKTKSKTPPGQQKKR